jgi:hypothetical protein
MSQDNEVTQDELTTLKTRADKLGITYHPSIGLDKLREKLSVAMSDESKKDVSAVPAAPTVLEAVPETLGQRRQRMKKEAHRLVRVRVTCMNPAKKEWDGELFTVGNNLVGSISKFVPFNADEGWHVPHILLEMLQARQCQVFATTKTVNGISIRQGKLIKEFAIEILDPLTPEELHDLAQRQAMAGSIG